MGTSFSVLCNTKRSVVVISASVHDIKEDVNDNIITSRKLHPCESRDSGIAENEINHSILGLGRVESDSEDHIIGDDSDDESSDDGVLPNEITKVSRPHSCRLGNRSASHKKSKEIVLAEDKLVKLLRNGKTGRSVSDENQQDIDREDSFYGDTNQHIPNSITKGEHQNGRKNRVKRLKNGNGTTVIGDLNSSSEESSDGEMWVIPDETGDQSRRSSQRKGWVSQDDVLDDESETSTFRSKNGMDYYRIKMDDLVTMFMTSLRERRRKTKLTQSDYEEIMKNLRSQLVAFVFSCINYELTPRIEVTSNSKTMFSEDPWAVQINLQSADEEILHTSEMQLANRLAKRGNAITKEDIACLLGDHLRTIEQLQHVRDSGRLISQDIKPEARQRLLSAPSSRKDSNNKRKKPPPSAHPKIINNQKSNSLDEEKGSNIGAKNKKIITKSKGSLKSNSVCPVSIDSDTDSTIANSSDCDTPKTIPNSPSPEGQTYWIQQTKNDIQIDADEAFISLNAPVPPKQNVEKIVDKTKQKTHLWTEANSKSILKKSTSDVNSNNIQYHSPDNHNISKLKKSMSLDEHRLQGTLPSNFVNDETVLAIKLGSIFWNKRKTKRLSDYCQMIQTARHIFVEKYGHVFHDLIKAETHQKKENGLKPTTEELEKEIKSLDLKFTKDILEKLDKNVVTEDILEKLLVIHMRKTSCVTVQTIKVAEAPISRTHSLTDAIDPRQDGFTSSAGSTISRKSEPDMRKWTRKDGLGVAKSNDIWGEVEKYQRAKSARSRVSTGKRRPGTTQVHGISPMEPLKEGMEDNNLTKVEETEGKFSVKSRPDSGIAVSMSSGSYSSYSSSEAAKEPHDDIDEACHTESSDILLDRVDKVKPEIFSDIKSLVAGITKGLTGTDIKAQALYHWLTRISLAKYARTTKRNSTPCARLRQLVEKKLSFAQFYQDLCKAAGIKCEKVEGYVKNKDYLPGNTVQSSKFVHTWNAISIDGQYRLVDPYFGSRKEKYFMDHYFATSPDDFILSHFPKEKKWMLMNQSLSVEDFEGTVKTWPAMFHFNIRPLSMKSVIRTYDGKLSVTVLLRNVAVIPQLEYAGPSDLDADSLVDNIDEEIRDSENAETFHITLPKEGIYYFTLLANIFEEEIDVPVFQYRIEYVDELL